MQISVKALINLVAKEHINILSTVFSSVLSSNYSDNAYVLTQKDADRIAAALDTFYANVPAIGTNTIFGEVITPKIHFAARRAINDATNTASIIFNLASLETPAQWIDR